MNNDLTLLLRRTAEHGKPEHTWAAKRFLNLLFVGAVIYIWLTVAILYVTAIVAALGASAANPKIPMKIEDFAVIGVSAMMFIATSAVWRRVPEMLIDFGHHLEDFVGRPVVIVQAVCHALVSDRFWYIRKAVGWLAVFGVFLLILWGVRLTAQFSPTIPHGINAGTALSHFITPGMLIFTFEVLVNVTISALAIRFGFAKKWRVIFTKPKYDNTKEIKLASNAIMSKYRLVHASDLHITACERAGMIETGEPIPDESLRVVFEAIENDAMDCEAVLLTGDITDDGAAESWQRFLRLLPESMHNKVILLPGNHDLNLQQGGAKKGNYVKRCLSWLKLVVFLKAERLDSFGRRMRQIRAMCVMTELMGERAYLIDKRTKRLTTLKDYFASHSAAIDAHVASSDGPRTTMNQIWGDMFPIVVQSGNPKVGFILIDSVKAASVNLTNAIGATPSSAISACESLMAETADRFECFVIALHHHLAIPSGNNWRDRFKSAFLVFENAIELVEMLTRRGEPSVVFHGHRHREHMGVVENSEVSVIATASATVGSHGRVGRGSWRVVELATDRGACRLNTLPSSRRVTP
ncbi:metallophosphoesterase [Burkholderia cenocepacia]|uniref:metallophosphoesterase family protein n=1 Tax=Burkholderia cenocepacia TaxID=95486 RepID=UPI00196B7894|nr:metallophosphoesterase [Burkholderia cenocepacia]MBN3534233.1 metallophosphoesterase [Burkholderia cenocepacia]